MENTTSPIETLFEKTEQYVRTSAELYKLQVIDKSADVLSTLSSHLAGIAFVALFFLTLNIGTALWIGESLGVTSYGFLIVSAFYALLGIILYLFRNRWIKTPVRNAIITQALN